MSGQFYRLDSLYASLIASRTPIKSGATKVLLLAIAAVCIQKTVEYSGYGSLSDYSFLRLSLVQRWSLVAGSLIGIATQTLIERSFHVQLGRLQAANPSTAKEARTHAENLNLTSLLTYIDAHYVELTAKDKHGRTPLLQAILNEEVKKALEYIQLGAPTNNAEYVAALAAASGTQGDADTLQALLSNWKETSYPNVSDSNERPWILAAQANRYDLVEIWKADTRTNKRDWTEDSIQLTIDLNVPTSNT